jgi:8-hydroxy-5-deazaflavin:NADPH oxidoreductase
VADVAGREELDMNVAIIGTGNVGSALARSLAKAGHAITITSTSPDQADAIAAEVGGKAAGTNHEAAEVGDVVIPAVYYDRVNEVLDEIGDALDGKILIDVTNRTAENPGLVVDGTSNAETIQAKVPQALVVKAFNTLFASRQADPFVDGVPVDAFVAGSDDRAKGEVLDLVRSTGANPVDVGPLEAARNLEAMGAMLIGINMQGGSWQNAWKILEPSA